MATKMKHTQSAGGHIKTPGSKAQPKPMSAKTASSKMGDMMHSKVAKTVAMKSKKKKAKY
jgi:hypothetical protein